MLSTYTLILKFKDETERQIFVTGQTPRLEESIRYSDALISFHGRVSDVTHTIYDFLGISLIYNSSSTILVTAVEY